jgi:SAM-dependent methyltransferase
VTVNPASHWCPADYARNAAFVPALGAAALGLLAPQNGEIILDLGCGDGALTVLIEQAGAKVIGLDASPEMVEAARARGIDAYVADAQALGLAQASHRFGQFDAAFSNAALHWMLDPVAVASGVQEVLKPGGRFVGEMGGEGNLATLRTALREELAMRGLRHPSRGSAMVCKRPGFHARLCRCGLPADRGPADPPRDGSAEWIVPWVLTFRSGFMDVAGVPESERMTIAEAVERPRSPQAPAPRRQLVRRLCPSPLHDEKAPLRCATFPSPRPIGAICFARSAPRRSMTCSSMCPSHPPEPARSKAWPIMRAN